jgi:hypothetical protein
VHVSKREILGHSVFSAQADKNLRNAPDDFRVAAEYLVEGDEVVNERPGGRMGGLVRPRQRLLAKRSRPFGVA